jgi:hypothetical protein
LNITWIITEVGRDISQEEQVLLENLGQFLMDPSHTAQCIDGWLHLQSRFPKGGKPASMFRKYE